MATAGGLARLSSIALIKNVIITLAPSDSTTMVRRRGVCRCRLLRIRTLILRQVNRAGRERKRDASSGKKVDNLQ